MAAEKEENILIDKCLTAITRKFRCRPRREINRRNLQDVSTVTQIAFLTSSLDGAVKVKYLIGLVARIYAFARRPCILRNFHEDQSTRETGWGAANAGVAPRAKDTWSELPDVEIFGPFPAG